MRLFFLLHLFLLWQTAIAQERSTFLDKRDGISYKTVEIDNSIWFQEDVRYQTKGSFCKGQNLKKEQCTYTNYYPYTELAEVCPTGWHVATLNDWENMLHVIKTNQGITEDLIVYDTFENGTIMMVSKLLKLMETTTPLRFKEVGWVQGSKINTKQATTHWINEERIKDDRYHIHFGDFGYSRHTHAHNIIDKKSKTRRFAVRCVKNKKATNEPNQN